MQSDVFQYQLLELTQQGRRQNIELKNTARREQSAQMGRMCHFPINTLPTLQDEDVHDSQLRH
jgi:hypothetical protein